MRRSAAFLSVVLCLAAAPARAALDEGPWVNFVADAQTYGITDVAVTIEADEETPGPADVVRWGAAPGVYPNTAPILNTCCSPGSNEIKEALIPVASLAPGGRVYYRLEYLGQVREGSFVAPPAPGEGFRLGVIGDNRSNPGRHQSIVNAFKNLYGDAANYPPLFVNTGDMVASGENEADWDVFFGIEADGGPLSLLGNMTFQPTFGNHENGQITAPTLYDRYFPNPRHFAYKYGNVLFVNVNSEDALAAKGIAQAALANANADPNIDFKVAVFHKPAVTTGDSHDPDPFMVGTFMDVFEGGNVDIVLQGHNHQYERSLVNGIHYVVTGAGGVGVGGFLDPNQAGRTSFSLVRASQDNFMEIDFAQGAYTATTYGVNLAAETASVLDAFGGTEAGGGFPGPTPADIANRANPVSGCAANRARGPWDAGALALGQLGLAAAAMGALALRARRRAG